VRIVTLFEVSVNSDIENNDAFAKRRKAIYCQKNVTKCLVFVVVVVVVVLVLVLFLVVVLVVVLDLVLVVVVVDLLKNYC